MLWYELSKGLPRGCACPPYKALASPLYSPNCRELMFSDTRSRKEQVGPAGRLIATENGNIWAASN